MRSSIGATVAMVALAVLVVRPAAAHRADPPPAAGPVTGVSIAPVRLTDQDGQPFDLASLRGAPVLVTFFYAACVQSCPLLTAQLVALRSEMSPAERSAVRFLSITVDPVRDRPPVLKDYARRAGLDPGGWTLLTGEPSAIVAVGKQFQLLFRREAGGSIDHTAAVYLLDRDHAVRGVYPADALARSAVLHDLAYLLGTHR